jgi:hypothetical protein
MSCSEPTVFAKSLKRISDSLIGLSVPSQLDVVLALPRLHHLAACIGVVLVIRCNVVIVVFKMVTVVLPF